MPRSTQRWPLCRLTFTTSLKSETNVSVNYLRNCNHFFSLFCVKGTHHEGDVAIYWLQLILSLNWRTNTHERGGKTISLNDDRKHRYIVDKHRRFRHLYLTFEKFVVFYERCCIYTSRYTLAAEPSRCRVSLSSPASHHENATSRPFQANIFVRPNEQLFYSSGLTDLTVANM